MVAKAKDKINTRLLRYVTIGQNYRIKYEIGGFVFMLNNISFWIASVIIVIVNSRKLIRSKLPGKYRTLLFISGTIYFGIFLVYVYHSDMIGMHDVLWEGYIQNGSYYVARPAHAPVQISEWDYKFNLILGIGTIVSLVIHNIVGIYVFWDN